MKKSLIILGALFTATLAAADPAGFKGIPFGTGCASFFQQYKPGGTWGESRLAPALVFSDSQQAIIATPPDRVRIMSGQVFTSTTKDSVAGAEATTEFFFAAQSSDDAAVLKHGITRWVAEKALFWRVAAVFSVSGCYPQVLSALTEKYGQPTRTEVRTITNKLTGNQAQVPVVTWEIPGAVVEFAQVGSYKGQPVLTITSTTVKSLAARADAKDL